MSACDFVALPVNFFSSYSELLMKNDKFSIKHTENCFRCNPREIGFHGFYFYIFY